MMQRHSPERAPLMGGVPVGSGGVEAKSNGEPAAGAAGNMPRWTDLGRDDRPCELNDAPLSTVQLLNTMIGSGVLSFPYVFANVGWALSLALLAASAAACYLTSCMLLAAGAAVGRPRGELSEVVEASLGVRWRKAVDICIALTCLGALLTYYNVIGALGSELLKGMRHADGDEYVVDTYAGFMVVAVAVFAAPPCFLRQYGELTPISIGSLLFICLTTGVMVGKGVHGGKAIPVGPKNWYQPLSLLGNFVYATSMQYAVFEMYASMKTSARPAVREVLAASIGGGCTLLAAMGLAGVAACGVGVDSDVLTSLDESTWLVKVLYVFTITHLLLYIPNDFIIGRLFFWRSWGVNYLQMPEERHYSNTALFVFGPLAVMAAIPRDTVDGVFELVIALTGEIPAAISAFLAPCLAYRAACLDKGAPDAPISRATVNVVLAATAVVLLVSPVVTIADFASDCVDDGCASYAS